MHKRAVSGGSAPGRSVRRIVRSGFYNPRVSTLGRRPMPRPNSTLRPRPLALAALIGCGALPSVAGPPPWQLSDDGGCVQDVAARLVWRRCAVGADWDGHACVGSPQALDHPQAQQAAAARAQAEGRPWRLPHSAELKHLAQQLQQHPDGGAAWFPGAPRQWHWSGSVSIQQAAANPYRYGNIAQGSDAVASSPIAFLHAWAVNLSTGEARGGVLKRTALPVRLVASQP